MVREVTLQGIREEKKLSSNPSYGVWDNRPAAVERRARQGRLYDPNPPADYMPGATPKPDNRTQSELASHGMIAVASPVVASMILASMFIGGFLPTTQGYFDHVDVAWFFWD